MEKILLYFQRDMMVLLNKMLIGIVSNLKQEQINCEDFYKFL